MSFVDGKRHVATAEDLQRRWSCGKPGEKFRCYLCGHRFAEGDGFRFVLATPLGVLNALTCDACDGPDVRERWVAKVKNFREEYWWAVEDQRA